MSPLTRLATRREKSAVADELTSVQDILVQILTHVGDHDGGISLARCEAISMAFREASMDSMMETTWRSLCLRMSPAAPIADDDDDEDDYVCTAFTNPTVDGVLAKSTATEQLTFRLLFLRRMRAAFAAQAARRSVGYSWCGYPGRVPLFCCTSFAAKPTSFAFEDLSFTFELFQDDCEREHRIAINNDFDERSSDDSSYEDEDCQYEDYLSPTVLSSFAAPPHYVNPRSVHKENLIWCSTVRGQPKSASVTAKAPESDQDEGGIARRTSVGIDTGMDDYSSAWAKAYRMVVTATRDTDGKMCQLVDVVCRDGKGFKEIDCETMTGTVHFMVVPDEEDEQEVAELNDGYRGLAVFCYFGSNMYGVPIDDQLEEPGADEAVDKAWVGMMNGAYDSLGALHELSISFEGKDQEGVAKALGKLQWY